MSYTSNLPKAAQSLGNSRPLFNQNFVKIQQIFDVDHVDFNDTEGKMGKHNVQHFPFAATGGQAATLAGEIAYYQKLVSAIPRLFFREPSSGTEQQWSGQVFSQNGALKQGGFTSIFGGIFIGWGAVTVVAGTPLPITFAAECGSAFPSNHVVVYPVAANVGVNGNKSVQVSAVTSAGCTLAAAGAKKIYFIAIGSG